MSMVLNENNVIVQKNEEANKSENDNCSWFLIGFVGLIASICASIFGHITEGYICSTSFMVISYIGGFFGVMFIVIGIIAFIATIVKK